MVNRCDCIVPFYNEGERIFSVVDALTRTQFIDQIICVDDGSTDHTSEELEKRFPKVRLVKLEKNRGKAGAVFAGLEFVKTKNILLLDGDLIGVQSEELEQAYKKFTADASLDMMILRAHGQRLLSLIDAIFRNYIIQSGIRILKTNDLREVELLHPVGYQLEVAINQFAMDSHKNVGWYPISALNLHKTHKLSLIEGWKKDMRMDREIMTYLGPVRRLEQILFFCRKKIV